MKIFYITKLMISLTLCMLFGCAPIKENNQEQKTQEADQTPKTKTKVAVDIPPNLAKDLGEFVAKKMKPSMPLMM